MNRDSLRVAYLCDMSPLDRNMYSGGNARIFDALAQQGCDLTIVDNDWGLAEPLRRWIARLPDHVHLRVRWRAHYALRRIIARRVQKQLAQGDFDVVFGAYSLHSMAGLRVPGGMVQAFTSDATQTVYRESEVGLAHERLFSIGKLLDGWAEHRERDTLRAMDLLLWPSQWLMDATSERYGLDQAHMVPWGANIAPPPPPQSRAIGRDLPVNLLVIGRDWCAKGGPVAFDAMQMLRAKGLDARLTVIGCTPPDHHQSAHVTVHPQLDKSKPAELALFEAALAQSHVLVQPSYESYGFAFCEASAHALPALCLRVGGVPVRDGVNGYALAPGATPADFAEMIEMLVDDPSRYQSLCQAARQEYESHLNWDAWGARVVGLLQKAVIDKRAAMQWAPGLSQPTCLETRSMQETH